VGITEIGVDKPVKEPMKKRIIELIKKHKKISIGIISSLCILLIIYFGMALYFMNHFYFRTEINGVDVSGKSVEVVNKQMAAELQTYTLVLKERGGKSEEIKAEEIGFKYSLGGEFGNHKGGQNPYKWVVAVFNTEGYKITEEVSYDKQLLKERIDKLSCFNSANIIEPKNPSIKYTNNSYEIIPESAGNKVDKDTLYQKVESAILSKAAEIDMESMECYVKPQYTSSSQKVLDAQNLLNKYVSSKITYTFGENKEILDGSTINKWLTVNENFEVAFNEKEAKNYVDVLAKNYNTVGKLRNFTSSSGKIINLDRGDYGRAINKTKETEALIAAIKEGQTIAKEPSYTQNFFSKGGNGVGNTYVEIDLTNQYMWFYKNGALLAKGSVVTGNVRENNTTPPGIYRLKYKQKNAVLRGPGYASPVTFWMPFNGGIGIHDAGWRSVFGGTIYKTNGSHGCVNSPYNLAKAIFENIEAGTPVICYN
jgi:hypothetical protein